MFFLLRSNLSMIISDKKRVFNGYLVSNSMRFKSTGTVWSAPFFFVLTPSDSLTGRSSGGGSGFGWVSVNGSSTARSLLDLFIQFFQYFFLDSIIISGYRVSFIEKVSIFLYHDIQEIILWTFIIRDIKFVYFFKKLN